MEPHEWERMQSLFHQALELAEPERTAFLELACGGQADTLARVRTLLAEDARTSPLLDRPITHVARDVLGLHPAFPEWIGPYRILRPLGEGGMGVVFLAERPDLGSRAAVKMLRDAWLSPARRDRFHSEQRTLARLNHPCIARLLDADTLPDGTPYIVMEYVEGRPLTRHCDLTEAPLRERLRLFREVCEAVRHAHAHAIIHRDLKPSNVLVTADGGVKLLDFGIARQLDTVDLPAEPTRTGLRLLTPAYAAPEQLLGQTPGVYSDVYALGVLLFELLTGRLPYELAGLTPAQVERRVLGGPAASLRSVLRSTATPLRPAVRAGRADIADLDVIIRKAMHREPQRRYATVDALIRDLDHFERAQPLDARPDSVAYRARKFVRRNRSSVAAAALLALTLLGFGAYHTARLAAERSVARAEAEKARVISEYLIGLFEAGDPFDSARDSLDVHTLLARGEARAEALAAQPAVQAEMLTVLGRVYTALSDYDRAEPLLLRALAIRRRQGDDPLGTAATLAALGRLERYTGDYDEGERYAREALLLREQVLQAAHSDIADAADILGEIVAQRGDHAAAETYYRRALDIRRTIHRQPDARLANSLNNLGVNMANQGDYAAAAEYLRESIAIGAAVLGADNPSLATDIANLGVVYEILGDYDAADSMLTEALRIKRLRLGSDHYETAFTLGQLGYVLMQAGRLERAESAFREALEISRRVLPHEHRDAGILRVNLSRVVQLRGDLETAEALLREGLQILAAVLGDDNEFTAVSRCRLAELLYQQRQPDESEALFRQCLGDLEQVLPQDHDLLAVLRSTFGATLRMEGRFAEAEPLLVAGHDALLQRFGPDHRQTRDAAERLRLLREAQVQTR